MRYKISNSKTAEPNLNSKNYILKDENSIYYECGYSCDSSIFLKLGSESFFITDARYTIEAKEQIKDCEVIECKKSIVESANELLKKSSIKELILDPKEWSLSDFDLLQKDLDIEFKRDLNFSWKKRIIKSDEEISLIKKAVELGELAFKRYVNSLKDMIGKDEKYIHFEAIEALSSHGEYELSFDPIIALDENSAKPHALPTKKLLKKDSFILFDAGLKYHRYCSDRTRCTSVDGDFHFEKQNRFNSAKHQKIYDLVLKAQEEAIKAIRPGMKAKEIDKIARDVIKDGGYEKYFVHSTGHGVGLDIHEFPFINKKNDLIIEENMIFTIEPGIYLEGEFGVRIEDMVVVKSDGALIL